VTNSKESGGIKLKVQTVCLVFAVATLLLSGTRSVEASVSSVNFMGAFYKGNDSFYGSSVIAYKAGSNVTVAVSAYNDYYYGYATTNITAVKIWFDWGVNYTSSEVSMNKRYSLVQYQSHVFLITLQLPTNVSNMVTHSYTVFVEHVYGLNGSVGVFNTWTYSGRDFAVYSSDQSDAQDLYVQLTTLGVLPPTGYSYYWPPVANFPYMPFVSSEARMLWSQARNEGTAGSASYARGDFAGAKSNYQTALGMIDQSFAAESETGKDYEGGFAGLMRGVGNAFNRSGDSVLILAIGIGVGAALFGVGILVYGLAKLRMARTPKSPT
jgi:phage shock protein PspC (stress-responsive transcriptional regulator)